MALGCCAAVGLPTSRTGSRSSIPSSSMLCQVPYKFIPLLFKFKVRMTDEGSHQLKSELPSAHTTIPSNGQQPLASRPFVTLKSVVAQSRRCTFPSGICALAVSPPVAPFFSKVRQPQLQSVPLTFKCSPMGRNLLSGVGDLTYSLHSCWEEEKGV